MTQPATADASTGRPDPSSSVAATFLDCARRRAGAEAFRSPAADGWVVADLGPDRGARAELAAGFLDLGHRRRGPGRHRVRRPGIEWVLADLGVLAGRGCDDDRLPEHPPRRRRLHPRRLRQRRRRRRGRRPAREGAGAPGRPARRAVRRADRPGGRRRRGLRRVPAHASTTSPSAAVRLLAKTPSAVDDRVAPLDPAAPRDADLHLGDDRASRRASSSPTTTGSTSARRPRRSGRAPRGPAAVPVAAAVARVRQAARRGAVPGRLRDRGRRPDRQDRREPRRDPADVHGRGAADLREGPRAG